MLSTSFHLSKARNRLFLCFRKQFSMKTVLDIRNLLYIRHVSEFFKKLFSAWWEFFLASPGLCLFYTFLCILFLWFLWDLPNADANPKKPEQWSFPSHPPLFPHPLPVTGAFSPLFCLVIPWKPGNKCCFLAVCQSIAVTSNMIKGAKVCVYVYIGELEVGFVCLLYLLYVTQKSVGTWMY